MQREAHRGLRAAPASELSPIALRGAAITEEAFQLAQDAVAAADRGTETAIEIFRRVGAAFQGAFRRARRDQQP